MSISLDRLELVSEVIPMEGEGTLKSILRLNATLVFKLIVIGCRIRLGSHRMTLQDESP